MTNRGMNMGARLLLEVADELSHSGFDVREYPGLEAAIRMAVDQVLEELGTPTASMIEAGARRLRDIGTGVWAHKDVVEDVFSAMIQDAWQGYRVDRTPLNLDRVGAPRSDQEGVVG